MTNDQRDALLIEIHSEVTSITGDLADVRKTMYGNGRPGLLERHNAVEQQQRSCPALQKELLQPDTRSARKANVIQILLMIITTAAVIVAAIK